VLSDERIDRLLALMDLLIPLLAIFGVPVGTTAAIKAGVQTLGWMRRRRKGSVEPPPAEAVEELTKKLTPEQKAAVDELLKKMQPEVPK
jgi:hypothetical protein